MEKMMAFCGVNCHECPAFLATKTTDDGKRAEVAKLWSKQFNTDIKTEDINCNGCSSDSGVLFGHCKTCEIRNCAIEKELGNCGHCSDYSCEKLNSLLDAMPDAKKRLNEVRDII